MRSFQSIRRGQGANMKHGRSLLLSIALAFVGTSLASAQGEGAGADFNRRDRERVKQMEIECARIRDCQKNCDAIRRVNNPSTIHERPPQLAALSRIR
jgi:hypothetical protein